MSEAKRARLFEPGWKYVGKDESDIRKTFARVRREQKLAEQAKATPSTVRVLRKPGAPK